MTRGGMRRYGRASWSFRWTPIDVPAAAHFGVRHAVAWALYLAVLWLNLRLLWTRVPGDPFQLIGAVVLSWIAVLIALLNLESWLIGANRWRAFRWAIVSSCAASAVLGAWMLWHYLVFTFIGVVTLFQRPLELISLTAFAARFGMMMVALAAFGGYAWLSLRTAWLLATTGQDLTLNKLLDEPEGAYRVAPVRAPEAAPSPLPIYRPAAAPMQPVPGLPPSSKRLPEIKYLRYHGQPDLERIDGCRAHGWPAFRRVLHDQPSLNELYHALCAMPHVAHIVDTTEADEARTLIEDLVHHPGSFEEDIPYQEHEGYGERTRTIRIAEWAERVLREWDAERGNLKI